MAASNQSVRRLLWSRFTWRHWRLAPVSSILLLLILSMGVAAFFSIRLANRAAVAGFQTLTDLITSESDGLITAPAGTLPDSVLAELRTVLDGAPVNLVPVLEGNAMRPRRDDNEKFGSRPGFHLLGLDLLALSNLAGQAGASGWGGSKKESGKPGRQNVFQSALNDSLGVFISDALARSDGLKPGSELAVVVNEHAVRLHINGIIPTLPDRPAPPQDLLVMDLPALQRLTDKPGRLDRVEFVLEPGPKRSDQWRVIRRRIETANSATAPHWVIGSSADRRVAAGTMTQAFRLNLTLLSLLALLVGLYLVFQGLDGAVVRRRHEISVLRSLGVTSRQIQAAWLAEAATTGLAGGLLGLGLGWLGAQVAVKFVGQTVNALYYANSVHSASFDFPEALVALLVAVAASTLAGWRPARLAAETPPAQIAARGGTSQAPAGKFLARPDLGCGLAVLGWLLTFPPPLRLTGGGRLSLAAYAAALCWLFAGGIFAGSLLAALGRFLQWLRLDSVPLRLAYSHLRAPGGRHRLAAAALVCAVGMTAGMAILVASFDTTMRGWIARTFQADLYISSDGAQTASSLSRISAATWHQVVANPAVSSANILQVMEINLGGISTLLVGNHLGFFRDFAHPAWMEPPLDGQVFLADHNSELALVSESFSDRFRLHRGDPVELPTPSGSRRVTIAGVFSDYGNERGSILVERQNFTNWFGNELAVSLILSLKAGRDAETLRGELRAAHPGLGIFTSGYLRGEALRIFRQTFALTYALELIGVVVAVAGLVFTLLSLLWERRADLATLRALGLRRNELAGAAALEGALTAAAGTGMGLFVSLALGWLLVHRVNKQTFGWTLQTDPPWVQLSLLALLVVASAAAAGGLAGRWATRLPAEREE